MLGSTECKVSNVMGEEKLPDFDFRDCDILVQYMWTVGRNHPSTLTVVLFVYVRG